MDLYTVVLEYAGGTYATQVSASDEQEALSRWIATLCARQAIGDVSVQVSRAFAEADEKPVPLEGLASAWCASAPAENGLALVNIVRTAT